jgi:hypothetical protein
MTAWLSHIPFLTQRNAVFWPQHSTRARRSIFTLFFQLGENSKFPPLFSYFILILAQVFTHVAMECRVVVQGHVLLNAPHPLSAIGARTDIARILPHVAESTQSGLGE